MNNMTRIRAISFAISISALTGCASLDRDFSDTPTAELCTEYMTLPSYNLWHGARAKELARRGESCGHPSEVAAARSQTDQAYSNVIQNTLIPPPPAPPGGYQMGTHTYYLNGRYYLCTTTAASTSCNAR